MKKLWPSFSFSTKGIGGMSSWASSVFARTPGKMIDGEQMGNAFPASDVPPGKLLIEESSSSIDARRAEDDGFERRDKDALAERIDDLEKELYDYQYHMGLLLIEKKTRASEIEELRRGLAEAKENVKPECTRELQDQELQSGRESLVVEELKYKLNKLGKHYVVLLAEKYEVEDDKRKIQKDKENLNILYNRLQNLNQELIRKRDLLLSLPQLCKTVILYLMKQNLLVLKL
ncbi:hypothetical protein KSP40_PGU020915 [Platanthera guangdongensis]|uniref:Uncharacterized protein n=1 Tax=Platanthera guangdongensis TaxID=2320717 RepID=A0ABR2LLE9_9ASPA